MGRSFTKKGLIGCTILGMGLTACGTGFSSQDIPDHEERVEYLVKELAQRDLTMEYSPDYQSAFFRLDDHEPHLITGLINKSRDAVNAIAILDEYDADGRFDLAAANAYSYNGRVRCVFPREQLTDSLVERLDRHYEAASEAGYRALTEGQETFDGEIGKETFDELVVLCLGSLDGQETYQSDATDWDFFDLEE